MRKLALLIGITISFLVGAYLYQTISLSEVVALILQIDKRWTLIFLICSFVMSVAHVVRYLTLLGVAGYRVNPILMYLVVLVRNLASDLLPARLGTLVYIYLINKKLSIPLAVASSSFAYATLFDVVALAPIVLVASFLAFAVELLNPATLFLIGLIFCILCVLLTLSIPFLANQGLTLSRRFHTRLLTKVSPSTLKLLNKLLSFAEALEPELQRTAKAGILGQILSLSLIIRIAKYSGLYSLLMALLTPLGYQIADLEPAKVFLGIFAAEISASLPISGLGSLGTYQGAWLAAFHLLNFPEQIAAITSVSHHLLTQAYGYSLGLLALLIFYLVAPSSKTK